MLTLGNQLCVHSGSVEGFTIKPEKKNRIKETPGIREYTVLTSGDRHMRASPIVADAKMKRTVKSRKNDLSSTQSNNGINKLHLEMGASINITSLPSSFEISSKSTTMIPYITPKAPRSTSNGIGAHSQYRKQEYKPLECSFRNTYHRAHKQILL